MLARREHSRTELQRKLQRKGHAETRIDQVLDDLAQEDWLSDTRFAESYLRVRIEKGYGPLHIQAQLRERGVAEALISELLEGCAVDWHVQAESSRRKRFGQWLPHGFQERARQARFLQSRGFSAEQIRQVLGSERDRDEAEDDR